VRYGPYDQDVTSRKPPGTNWESWIDQVIRDGRERGEFDDLPGAGKPLAGLDKPHDEMWWVRNKVRSEGISYLPPALALRKDREDTLARLDATTSETRVRQLLEELNSRIRHVNSRSISGPPSTVMPVDIELVVQGWRERRTHALLDEGRPQDHPGTVKPLAAGSIDGSGRRGAHKSSRPKTRRGGPTAGRLRWPRRNGVPADDLE
jgi:hypothetical protein